jgi:hypothetical protein
MGKIFFGESEHVKNQFALTPYGKHRSVESQKADEKAGSKI